MLVMLSTPTPSIAPSSEGANRRRARRGDGVAEGELQPGSLYDLCRSLADPTRLRILGLLGEMELAIGEIAQLLDQSQPRVSRHVRLLEEVGLVERRREGSWVFVRPALTTAAQHALALIAQFPISERERAINIADRRRLAVIQAERESATQRYFEAHAGEWDAIRALHVDETRVDAALLALWPERPFGHLADIGTGTGRMVELLAGRAAQVTAVDRSPEMLRVARSRLPRSGPPVTLVHGDATRLPLADQSVDTAVMHHLLHFIAAPGRALEEMGRVLSVGGRFAIVDFAAHDQEMLRRDSAHVWLGFSDAQLRDWAAQAGLALEGVERIADGPLTVNIWHGRRTRPRAEAVRRTTNTTESKENAA